MPDGTKKGWGCVWDDAQGGVSLTQLSSAANWELAAPPFFTDGETDTAVKYHL